MRRPTDKQVEILIGKVLRSGVLLSCFVTLIGLVLYLMHYAAATPSYHVFHSINAPLRSVYALIPRAFHGYPLAIIQLGVLLLIATPVARVAFLVGAFALEGDRMYVVVSATVLIILLGSILFAT
ncbi:MAG TPA: DUF1634 domain-containing protein [Acidobacteriaceae bacterium]|nr:DUF1634 domain-containing protein [Acidobacteriaceae bacterium]